MSQTESLRKPHPTPSIKSEANIIASTFEHRLGKRIM